MKNERELQQEVFFSGNKDSAKRVWEYLEIKGIQTTLDLSYNPYIINVSHRDYAKTLELGTKFAVYQNLEGITWVNHEGINQPSMAAVPIAFAYIDPRKLYTTPIGKVFNKQDLKLINNLKTWCGSGEYKKQPENPNHRIPECFVEVHKDLKEVIQSNICSKFHREKCAFEIWAMLPHSEHKEAQVNALKYLNETGIFEKVQPLNIDGSMSKEQKICKA